MYCGVGFYAFILKVNIWVVASYSREGRARVLHCIENSENKSLLLARKLFINTNDTTWFQKLDSGKKGNY